MGTWAATADLRSGRAGLRDFLVQSGIKRAVRAERARGL